MSANFNKVSDMLLNKLTEDYVILSEEADWFSGNVPEDSKEALKQTLRNKAAETEAEAQDSFHKQKDAINPRFKRIFNKKHKKDVYDREEAKQKIRAVNLIESVDDLDDDDVYYLAEEFDNDLFLEELNQQDANAQETLLNNNIEKEKDKLAEQKNKMAELKEKHQQEEAQLKQQMKDQKAETQQQVAKDQEDAINKQVSENNKETEQLKTGIEKSDAKLEKMQQVKNYVKDRGDNMQDNLKEEVALQEGIIKAIKQAQEDRKMAKAKKKRDKVNMKIDKIDTKLIKLNADLKKADWNHKIDKCEKITKKIEKLNLNKEQLTRDYKKYDEDVATGEFQQSLREEAILDERYEDIIVRLDTLEEEVDQVQQEVADEIESEKQPDNVEKYDCVKILANEKQTVSPMLLSIIQKIKEELAKENPDERAINILKMKYKKYSEIK